MHRHIVPSRESRSLTPPPESLLFEKLFQILLRRGDGSNAEILYEVVQHIGRNERRQRGAKANILDPQIQQRQQNAHRLLLIPRKHHGKRQLVHAAAERLRRNAIEGYSLPKQSLDHITSIDLTLKGGDFEILYVSGAGTDFTLDGDYSVATSSFTQNGKWTANIWANSGTVTLIIPRDSTSFREIDIACTQSANLFIEDNLSADSIKLSTQDGTLTTNGLYAQNISLHTNTGNISASLLESNLGRCHIQAHTNGGPVTLNGTSLVQLNEDGSGTALYDNRYDTETQSYRLDFSLDLNATVGGSGRIDLLSKYEVGLVPQDAQGQDVT